MRARIYEINLKDILVYEQSFCAPVKNTCLCTSGGWVQRSFHKIKQTNRNKLRNAKNNGKQICNCGCAVCTHYYRSMNQYHRWGAMVIVRKLDKTQISIKPTSKYCPIYKYLYNINTFYNVH